MKLSEEKPRLSRVECEERMKVRNGMYQPIDRKRQKVNYIIMFAILIFLIIFGIYSYSLL